MIQPNGDVNSADGRSRKKKIPMNPKQSSLLLYILLFIKHIYNKYLHVINKHTNCYHFCMVYIHQNV